MRSTSVMKDFEQVKTECQKMRKHEKSWEGVISVNKILKSLLKFIEVLRNCKKIFKNVFNGEEVY